ncbi:hypothetical protein F5883DRAFT_483824 [Diaporthe sp. PMI_573]|nr:hypothetical protein F5883DRAFT_483824 [Diaporthaceae sp. PMI_573]
MELSSYASVTPIRKLKDSCDLCSSSKVRCDKTKPACSRCVSLGHSCSYSPARRAGRPHRIHTQSKKGHSPSLAGDSRLSDPASIRNSSPFTSGMSMLDDAAFFGTQTRNHNLNNHHQQQHIQEQSTEASCRNRSAGGPDTGAFDCFSVATCTLEQLEIARQRSDFTHSTSTITEACQRLLTILICPCSEKSLVALLLASGCISLMNTARDLSKNCFMAAQDTGTSPRPSTGTTPAALSSTESSNLDYFSTFNWPMPPPSSSSNASLAGSNGSFGVEELARIAKVISHFTERYCQGPKGGTPQASWAHTTWLLEPLVASLRLKLQSVTLEATERLVL